MNKWKRAICWAAACVLALTVFAAYAQTQGSQLNLPDGVKMRLGKGAIQQIAYSPDSRILAAGGSLGIWIYDAGTGAETALLQGHTAQVWSIAYSPDGKTLASGSADRTICVWDAQTGALLKTLTGHTAQVWSIAYSPDNKTIASGSDGTFSGKGETVRVWDVETGEQTRALEVGMGRILAIAFSPDGKTIACADDSFKGEDAVYLYDVETGEPIRTLRDNMDTVQTIAFSPDGKTLASGSGGEDKTVRIWDPSTGALLKKLAENEDWIRSRSVFAGRQIPRKRRAKRIAFMEFYFGRSSSAA